MNSFYRILNNHFKDISAIGSPIVLMIILFIQLNESSTFLYSILGLFLIEIVCSLIKITYFKPRPQIIPFENILDKINSSSFPSIHSARITFAATIMLYNTDSLIKKLVFIFLILYVCYSRIYLKNISF